MKKKKKKTKDEIEAFEISLKYYGSQMKECMYGGRGEFV